MTHLWCTRLVLVALARRLARRARPFTVDELLAWCPDLKQLSTARFACRGLRTAGLLEPAPAKAPSDNQNPYDPARWQLTSAGKEATKAAVAEAASSARSRTMARLNQCPRGNPLPQRLWTLLRARRRLTSVEAAETLGDAGADHRSMVKAISRYLSCWAAVEPSLVQIGARRVAGAYQYVLVADAAPHQLPSALRNAEAKAAAQKEKGCA